MEGRNEKRERKRNEERKGKMIQKEGREIGKDVRNHRKKMADKKGFIKREGKLRRSWK